MNPIDTTRLETLAAWMRTSGVCRVVVDGERIEMELGAVPSPAAEAPSPPTAAELEQMAKKAAQDFDDVLFGRRLG